MKKLLFIFFISLSTLFCAASFDWPEEKEVQSDSFYSYFGQLRGDTMSSSLVFSEESEVKTCDAGSAVCILSDSSDDDDFFPSTLGNAVIIAHKDNILTVYGNLSEEMNAEVQTFSVIPEGTFFSKSADSAWQNDKNGLEFQVIDVKNNSAINPRILMPRIGKELQLYLNGITLKSRNGHSYKVSDQNVLPQGNYRIYFKRQNIAVPYKTTVTVNGVEADSVTYDLLKQDDGLLCAQGKRNYPKSIVYPDRENMLLGEVTFTPGKNAVLLNLQDILGKESHVSFYISNY